MCEKQAKKPPITQRPANLLKPEWEQLRTNAIAVDGCDGSDEDVLTWAMFPKVAPKFFPARVARPQECCARIRNAPAASAARRLLLLRALDQYAETIKYEVKLDGKTHQVTISPA